MPSQRVDAVGSTVKISCRCHTAVNDRSTRNTPQRQSEAEGTTKSPSKPSQSHVESVVNREVRQMSFNSLTMYPPPVDPRMQYDRLQSRKPSEHETSPFPFSMRTEPHRPVGPLTVPLPCRDKPSRVGIGRYCVKATSGIVDSKEDSSKGRDGSCASSSAWRCTYTSKIG